MIILRSIAACAFFIAWNACSVATTDAAEIDSVTTRRIPLDDSRAAINAIINARLRAGVDNANQRHADIADLESQEFCDEEHLYLQLRRAIFDSFLPGWGLGGYDLDRQLREALTATSYSLMLEDSIYRDISYLEGFSLRLKELSDVVRVDDHLLGVDKLGHFFAEGWEYFERTQQNGRTLEEAMRWGSRQEAGKYGYATTGIFSFADLVANFNGFRFWRAVLGEDDDPLLGPIGNWFTQPYVVCKTRIIESLRHRKIVKSWVLRREFNISDYIDGAWDEGNNCNSYADPMIEQKVADRIGAVSPSYRCPVQPTQCLSAREKYGGFARHLLHPSCLAGYKR
ncbi:MAG: hypothetical protein V2I82_14580 [Halieaceae bacterium]|jgi:hypothetical protein|nr:hypothetical protein [Halieaceae bacterium]